MRINPALAPERFRKLKPINAVGERRLVGLCILELLRRGRIEREPLRQELLPYFAGDLYPEHLDQPIVTHVRDPSLKQVILQDDWMTSDNVDIFTEVLDYLVEKKVISCERQMMEDLYDRYGSVITLYEENASESVRDWFAAIFKLSLLERLARGI